MRISATASYQPVIERNRRQAKSVELATVVMWDVAPGLVEVWG
jgi:hypothetical protein